MSDVCGFPKAIGASIELELKAFPNTLYYLLKRDGSRVNWDEGGVTVEKAEELENRIAELESEVAQLQYEIETWKWMYEMEATDRDIIVRILFKNGFAGLKGVLGEDIDDYWDRWVKEQVFLSPDFRIAFQELERYWQDTTWHTDRGQLDDQMDGPSIFHRRISKNGAFVCGKNLQIVAVNAESSS
jgi:hypothetical protein